MKNIWIYTLVSVPVIIVFVAYFSFPVFYTKPKSKIDFSKLIKNFNAAWVDECERYMLESDSTYALCRRQGNRTIYITNITNPVFHPGDYFCLQVSLAKLKIPFDYYYSCVYSDFPLYETSYPEKYGPSEPRIYQPELVCTPKFKRGDYHHWAFSGFVLDKPGNYTLFSIYVFNGTLPEDYNFEDNLEGTSETRGLIESNTSFPVGIALEVYAKANNENQSKQHFCSMRKAGDDNYRGGDVYGSITEPDIVFQTKNAGNKTSTTDISATFSDKYHNYKVTWKEGNSKFYIDNIERASHTTNIPTIDQVIYFQEGNTSGDIFEIDWVFVRKYIEPEPSYSYGAWQSLAPNTPPVLSNPSPANGSTDVQLQPDVSIHVVDPDGDTMTITINLTNADGGWQNARLRGGD